MSLNNPKGSSVKHRMRLVDEIYKKYSREGLSNKAIWRFHVWPILHISEATFYRYISRYEIDGGGDLAGGSHL